MPSKVRLCVPLCSCNLGHGPGPHIMYHAGETTEASADRLDWLIENNFVVPIEKA